MSSRDEEQSAAVLAARPVEADDPSLDSVGKRLAAWTNMIVVDHGFIRLAHLNLHRVGRDAWRSAQPAPHHIARVARLGVRTVVSLRGGRRFGSYPLEVEACRAHGIAFEEITLRSRDAPKRQTLAEVAALLDRIAYPALFHCKAGADRAGLMSALYLLLREGASVERAQAQLSWRFLHVRQGPTGVLDAFLEMYAQADARHRAETGEPLDFLTWSQTEYNRKTLQKSFKSNLFGRLIVDRLLARE
ncbi:MAG: tyrosine-protein phosphatase [Pseudomonadota bacterium]